MKNTVPKSHTIDERVIYLFLLLTSAIFILLFARSTSPLYTYYGFDSPIFISMANTILDGKTIYVDTFDHKGPVLFYIQALGQMLVPGRTGIFILQIVNLFLALVFLYKSVRIFTSSLTQIACAVISFLFLLSLTIEEGNQTEELSLFFVFASIYITFSIYFNEKSLSTLRLIALGLCFSVIFWIRPNNAGIICACLAFLLIVYLRKKQWGLVLKTILLPSITFLTFSAAICLWFAHLNAMHEMLFASFTFNFKYIKYEFSYTIKSLLMSVSFNFFIMVSLCFGVYSSYKKDNDRNIIFLFALLLLFGFLPPNMIKFGMFQYKGLLVPIFSISLMLFFWQRNISEKEAKILKLTSVVMLVLMSLVFVQRYMAYRYFDSKYVESAQKLVEQIPEQERDQVFGYQTEAKIFVATDLKPTFKYYIFQEFHGKHDKRVIEEVNNMLKTKKPLWVFTQNSLMSRSTNKLAQEILTQDYYVFYKNEDLSLYHLKE